MSILPIKISDKITIIGYSGSGKTTLLKYLIKNIDYPMIVIDTTNHFTYPVNIRKKGKLTPLKEFNFHNKSYIKIQSREDLEDIMKKTNDNYSKPIIIVVDEIDNFIGIRTVLPETSLYLQQGRNYNHGGIFTVRQVGLLNKQILSNSHYLFLFKIYNKNDIDYLSSIVGYPLQNLVINLGNHEFYIVDLQNTKVIGKFLLVTKAHRTDEIIQVDR